MRDLKSIEKNEIKTLEVKNSIIEINLISEFSSIQDDKKIHQ